MKNQLAIAISVLAVALSTSLAANSESLIDKEIVSAFLLSKKCNLQFLKYTDKARYKRVVSLPYITDQAACSLDLPEVNIYSFKTAGLEAKVAAKHVQSGVNIKKNESTAHNTEALPIYGAPIPGLKPKTLESCDNTHGECKARLTVAFWNEKGQHIISNHRMSIFKKDTPVKGSSIKYPAYKLFPGGAGGVIPAGTVVQRIRTTVEWMSGGEFQRDSCIGLWLGEDTSGKPDQSTWGCGKNRTAPADAEYLILD